MEWKEEVCTGDNRILVLVIYDVTNDKQRNRVVSYLKQYGHRVQKSAFEARVSQPMLEQIKRDLKGIVTEDDSVRIYRLNGQDRIFSLGEVSVFEEDVIII